MQIFPVPSAARATRQNSASGGEAGNSRPGRRPGDADADWARYLYFQRNEGPRRESGPHPLRRVLRRLERDTVTHVVYRQRFAARGAASHEPAAA